jgi:HEAT repeat protein
MRNDQSESVRAIALQTADEKNVDTKLKVFGEAITSKYEDVKEAAVPALVDMSGPQAVDTLIEGLKDANPNFRNDVTQALDFLISHECTGYGECKSWWNANRNRFDNELNEKDAASI